MQIIAPIRDALTGRIAVPVFTPIRDGFILAKLFVAILIALATDGEHSSFSISGEDHPPY